ncbi:MAG: hypothetical protein JSW39_24160 [Desulfobacterales bacterium]|nr:MAG: hypothetical protein JSW39_24160 [Desulfobacterales bacterium]
MTDRDGMKWVNSRIGSGQYSQYDHGTRIKKELYEIAFNNPPSQRIVKCASG